MTLTVPARALLTRGGNACLCNDRMLPRSLLALVAREVDGSCIGFLWRRLIPAILDSSGMYDERLMGCECDDDDMAAARRECASFSIGAITITATDLPLDNQTCRE